MSTDTGTDTRTSTYEQIAAVKRLSGNFDMDLYEVLELTREAATADDIKKSYRRLCFLTHPDKNDQTIYLMAGAALNLVREAYAVLNVPEKKGAYDRQWQKSTAASSIQLPADANVYMFDFSTTGHIKVTSKTPHPFTATRTFPHNLS